MTAIPEAGDLVWVDFNPQAGHDKSNGQVGQRPAIVLSPRVYHEKTALAVVCPITSNTAPYPFKVMLPDGLPIAGAVLADRVKSIDRVARRMRVAGRAPEGVVADVRAKLAALLGAEG